MSLPALAEEPEPPPAAASEDALATAEEQADKETQVAETDGQDDQAAPAAPPKAERIRVTGSRRALRAGGDTLAPLDVLTADDLRHQGAGEIDYMLRTVIPSLNVHTQPISDAGSVIRPVNLRGLAPDQMLVLVNGKRRHRGAAITFWGLGLADGAQGPDVGSLPPVALERVEVLRDGAAAQYGSDAIAGVLNFVLKDAADGVLIDTKLGQAYAGDGAHRQVAANLGLPLTAGFLNLSAEFQEKDATSRSVQHPAATAVIERRMGAGLAHAVREPYAAVWGQTALDDDLRTAFNLERELGASSLYAFGNYSRRRTDGGFYYRSPDRNTGIYTVRVEQPDGAAALGRLIGDRAQAAGAVRTCPEPAEVIVGSADEFAQLAQIAADPNCWTYADEDLLPGGFTPHFGGKVVDHAAVLGVRGERGGIDYDASVSRGTSDVRFFIRSLNPSLGPDASGVLRRDFGNLGAYTQNEISVNLDLSYPWQAPGLASPVNVAAGAEWREEEFEASAGEADSWRAGPYAAQGFTVAASGFPGIAPTSAFKKRRSNVALYADLEADVADRLTFGAALRWEDFQQFGATANWKLAGLYRLRDGLRLRASVHTGFRVPTVGQAGIVSLNTSFDPDLGSLINAATISPSSGLARLLGAKPLTPEESDSLSLGAILDLGAGQLTVDYFRIDIDGRIARTEDIDLARQVAAGRIGRAELDRLLQEAGFNANLRRVTYFVNDYDTRTRGIDVVYTAPLEVSRDGDTELIFSGNWTQTEVVRSDPRTVGALRVGQLEHSLPNVRFNATLRHDAGHWRAQARINFFGAAVDYAANSLPGARYGSEATLDVEVGYRPRPGWEFVVGAENLFDNFPDSVPGTVYQNVGSRYPESASMGTLGGFYYARVRREF